MSLEQMKSVIGLEQFYSVLPGELKYLVRDKKPKNIQEASETADSINEIRNPRLFEVEIGTKVWDDRRRGPRDYLRNIQATGSHFKGKPSELSHQKHNSFEGKGDKYPYFEPRANKTCYVCGEKGHF